LLKNLEPDQRLQTDIEKARGSEELKIRSTRPMEPPAIKPLGLRPRLFPPLFHRLPQNNPIIFSILCLKGENKRRFPPKIHNLTPFKTVSYKITLVRLKSA
jgi:hypothetical protein